MKRTVPLLLLSTPTAVLAWNCWLPDGVAFDNKGMTPCNATLADTTGSACCDPRDSCSTSGLCLGASGAVYRGGCTSEDWSSPNCAAECRSDPLLKIKYSRVAFLWNCGITGLWSEKFCCGSYITPEKGCCDAAFTFTGSGLAFKGGRDAELQQLSSAAAAATNSSTQSAAITTVTVTATPSTDVGNGNGNGSKLGLAIGAGVGIPLGLLALGIVFFLFWKAKKNQGERRREDQIGVDSPLNEQAYVDHGERYEQTTQRHTGSQHMPYEIDSVTKGQ